MTTQNKVIFVIPKSVQAHLTGLIGYYKNSDSDREVIGTYLTRLAKILNTIAEFYDCDVNKYPYYHKFKPINRSPYGIDTHKTKYYKSKPIEVGFLKPPLGDCISRKIDGTNRLVAFEIDKNIVGVISVIGHYNKNPFNNIALEDLVSNLEYMYRTDQTEFNLTKQSSKLILDVLYTETNIIKNQEHPGKFNKLCRDLIFPLDLKELNNYFDLHRQSIQTQSKNKTIYQIQQEKDQLDDLNNQIYKILKYTINLSYFVAIVSTSNKLEQLNKIIPPNSASITNFSETLKKLEKHKAVFNNPTQVVDRTLHACSTALAQSFNYCIDNDLINEFALRFKNEVDYDIASIQKARNDPNNITPKELNLEKTTIFLEEFYIQKIHYLKSTTSFRDNQVSKLDKSYYDIPFFDRTKAKNIGAKWDLDVSHWYIPNRINLKKITNLITQGWRKLTDKEVNEAREQKRAINAKNSSMLDRLQNNVSNSDDQRNVQKIDNCIEIPFSISPKDFQGVEALGAFFDKEKEKWFVPKDPKTIKAVGKYLSEEETAKRRVNEAIACQKRKKEEKLNQQDQKKNKKNKGR